MKKKVSSEALGRPHGYKSSSQAFLGSSGTPKYLLTTPGHHLSVPQISRDCSPFPTTTYFHMPATRPFHFPPLHISICRLALAGPTTARKTHRPHPFPAPSPLLRWNSSQVGRRGRLTLPQGRDTCHLFQSQVVAFSEEESRDCSKKSCRRPPKDALACGREQSPRSWTRSDIPSLHLLCLGILSRLQLFGWAKTTLFDFAIR